MFVADGLREFRHYPRVLDSKTLLAEMARLRDEGRTTNAELGRLLKLPSSRIAEIFDGGRKIKIDEMKIIVEHFGLEPGPVVPSADTLEPILDALLPLAPPGRVTAQSRRALSEALSYGLELLGSQSATEASSDAISVAARAAVARFREIARLA